MTSRILILGGTGFIGSHVAAALVDRGHEVTILSRNQDTNNLRAVRQDLVSHVRFIHGSITDVDALKKAISDIDIIYHKAAFTGVEASALDSLGFVETNIKGTATLAQLLKTEKHVVQKVILGSSISTYGEGSYFCKTCGSVRPALRYDTERFDENQGWNPPCPSCSGVATPRFTNESAERYGESIYAITKKAQEDLMLSICHQLEISLITFRYTTVVGPNLSASSPYSRFTQIIAGGRPVRIFEDGKQSRDFVYVTDVVNANVAALQFNGSGVFNIGSGVQTPLIEFIRLLKSTLESRLRKNLPELEITQTLCRGDVRHCYADISQARSVLGYSAKIDLQAGISNLVSWNMESNRDSQAAYVQANDVG